MAQTEREIKVKTTYEDGASEGLQRLAQELESLRSNAQVLVELDGAVAKAQESAQSLKENYSSAMSELTEDVRGSFSNLIEGGYMALAKAVSALATSGQNSARTFGKAMMELSANAVLAIGKQAMVKAVFALAEGLLFKDPSALTAAKLYGVVAGMAMSAGASLMASASQAGESGGSSRGAGERSTSGARSSASVDESKAPAGIVVNVTVQGHVVDTRAFVEEHVAPALAEAVGRGATARGEYNLAVMKD